jgi:peptidoglycan/LPS O-acetylase OafA/YrhL
MAQKVFVSARRVNEGRRYNSGLTRAHDNPGGALARLPALDGLRGIAILLVIGIHFGVAAGFTRWPGRVGLALTRIFYVGWTGVDLFFVLSGFLITSILLATRSEPDYFRNFYARRALRIFPLHYVTLVLALIVLPRVLPAPAHEFLGQARDGQWWLWTYTLNIANVFGWLVNAGVLAQFWTLAIEEQYYLVWPAVVKRASSRALLAIGVFMVVGAFVLRLLWVSQGGPGGWQGAYRFTFTRIDALAVGGLIALAVRLPAWRGRLERMAPAGFGIGLAAVAATFLWLPRFYPSDWRVVTFGHSLLALTFGWLVVLAVRTPSHPVLGNGLLRLLGRYSYGIYVWHWPLQNVMLSHYVPVLGPGKFFVTGLLGSFALAWVSYHAIELPFLHLKRFVAYGHERRPVESTAVA